MTQNELILLDLKCGKKITQIDAYNRYNCTRLAARVKDLKNDGHNIKTKMISTPSNKGVAQYYMEKR